jgi:hypothetical protein
VFETQLTFDHSLYNIHALDETSEAYGEHLSVTLTHGESSTDGKFTVEEDDDSLIIDAFCNHVLFLTIQAYRQGSEA